VKKNPFPKKKDPRDTEALTDDAVNDEANPPQEIPKSYTAQQARDIIATNLKPMVVDEFETEIVGDDLITHKWSEKAMKEMLKNQQMTKEEKKLAKMNRTAKNPKEDFEGARYRWDNKDWFPSNGVKKAMVSAGFALGIPRALIQRCVFVSGDTRRDYVEIKYGRIVMREDAVRVGPFNKREADLRYRPEYQNWSAKLRIRFRSDMITHEQVLMLIENAGFSIGIGEWRPERSGQAGTFQIRKVEKKEKRRAA
jgi:hypothetical protein